MDMSLYPGLEPRKIIINLAKRFHFRDLVLDDIDRIESSDELRATVRNLCDGIDAEAILKEDITPQGYAATLCKYTGPVVGFLDGKRQVVRAEISAYVFLGCCRGRFVRKAERHGDTPEWWPFEDSY